MADPPTHNVTMLLTAVGQGKLGARERLWEIVYDELHRMAKGKMAHEFSAKTLQPTALVNEVFLRFAGNDATFENRRHFFAAAARAMHQICVDDARRRRRLKRKAPIEGSVRADEPAVRDRDSDEILALDEALKRLATLRPEWVEVVRLRYFVGLSLDETAEVLDVARRTVVNQWRLARAWLYEALAESEQTRED